MSPTLVCQIKSCLGVMTLSLLEGMAIGWSSPGLDKMLSNEAPFALSQNEATQIVALFDIGVMLGSWTSTVVFSVAGRKQTVMVGPVALAFWVILTSVGSSTAMLIAARLLAGCGMGIVLSFSFIYVGEVTTRSARGPLILSTTLLMPFGQLIAFLVGSRVTWIWQSVYPSPIIVLMVVFVVFLMQESPYYYAMRERHDDLEKSLRALRVGVPEGQVVEELESIKRAVKQQREDATTWREMFSPPGAKKAAAIVLVQSSALALLGVTNVLAYTHQIFEFAGTDFLDKEWSSVLVIITEIVMVCVAMVLIERLGRRLQLSLAACGTCLSTLCLSAYFACKEVWLVDVSAWNWVPLLTLLVYIGCVGGGINTVPSVLMSELLDQRAKAVISPLCMTILSLTSYGINSSFLKVGINSGFWVPFLFFACTNFSIGLFTLLVVPETKGRSLAEVQDMLRGRRSNKEVL